MKEVRAGAGIMEAGCAWCPWAAYAGGYADLLGHLPGVRAWGGGTRAG